MAKQVRVALGPCTPRWPVQGREHIWEVERSDVRGARGTEGVGWRGECSGRGGNKEGGAQRACMS